ncbi:YwqJ-related putative deaminase [Phytohabitans sp. ZYX-F-186]|uniref:YwqJ-related putative deaminase n=1 Tax=Phytohabitans maris TaxID=3071409 RepID=A0ABU0ZLC8_9ACTN|nr:YwqJ-related putative deaminase [Phytohabitans sp. ZYX-F-186]MDQ7907793.1 YwqJ-related putative deaminase [Phytohabitans sp. ZYX-F-186]
MEHSGEASVLGEWEAKLIAAPWAYQDKPVGAERSLGMREFDLGYVFWREFPQGDAAGIGAGQIVVDKATGELTYWPSVPPDTVALMYQDYRREAPAAPLTWDPVARAEYDRLRATFPENVTHLRLADGRLRRGRSMKGAGSPNLHPLVAAFLTSASPAYRERGGDRCAEVAAISDALHAEDARRAAAGQPPVGIDEARAELLRGAEVVTYRVREPGDPTGGQPSPPCVSCMALLRHFGFALQSPDDAGDGAEADNG